MTKYTEKEIKEMDEQELVEAISNKNISIQDLININIEMTEPIKISLLKSANKKEFSDIMEYFIYKKLITEEVMLIAIEKDVKLSEIFIKEKIPVSLAVLKALALKNNNYYVDTFNYLLKDHKNLVNEEMMLFCLGNNVNCVTYLIKAEIPMTEDFVKAVRYQPLGLYKNDCFLDIIDYLLKHDKKVITEDIMLIAIGKNMYLMDDFIEAKIPMSESFLSLVVKEKSKILEYHKELFTKEIILEAIKENSDIVENVFKYRNELDNESFKLAMVNANYLTIQHIKFPSKEVQMAAVLQNKDAVKHIKNPCEVVKKYLKEGVVAIKKEAIESLKELIEVGQDLEKNIDGCDDENIAKQKFLMNIQNQNNN